MHSDHYGKSRLLRPVIACTATGFGEPEAQQFRRRLGRIALTPVLAAQPPADLDANQLRPAPAADILAFPLADATVT